MAPSVRLFLAGTGTVISMAVIYLLVFVNGIVSEPMIKYIMAGDYKIAFGINMIPVIQWSILALALGSCIICMLLTVREIYSEVAYYPEY